MEEKTMKFLLIFNSPCTTRLIKIVHNSAEDVVDHIDKMLAHGLAWTLDEDGYEPATRIEVMARLHAERKITLWDQDSLHLDTLVIEQL
jgi:hypothetical protein